MSMKDFRNEIEEEMKAVLSSDFKIEITETTTVPSLDDSDITYPNLTTGIQKCKLIETCVLYIDLRKSTDLNLTHRRETLSKLYSTFIRSVMKAAGYFGGKVRNVVGDRVMVVFDKEKCFVNAYNTAVLFNSVVNYLLNQNFKNNDIKAGIGIDYGKMLVTKAGIIKLGYENKNYKSLVWLGRPANIASKLTDLANKTTETKDSLLVNYLNRIKHFPDENPLVEEISFEEFFGNDLFEYTGWEKSKTDEKQFFCPYPSHPGHLIFYYLCKKINVQTKKVTTKTILLTEDVYNGLKKEAPDIESLKEGWITEDTNVDISGYSGKVYGSNVYFTDFK